MSQGPAIVLCKIHCPDCSLVGFNEALIAEEITQACHPMRKARGCRMGPPCHQHRHLPQSPSRPPERLTSPFFLGVDTSPLGVLAKRGLGFPNGGAPRAETVGPARRQLTGPCGHSPQRGSPTRNATPSCRCSPRIALLADAADVPRDRQLSLQHPSHVPPARSRSTHGCPRRCTPRRCSDGACSLRSSSGIETTLFPPCCHKPQFPFPPSCSG